MMFEMLARCRMIVKIFGMRDGGKGYRMSCKNLEAWQLAKRIEVTAKPRPNNPVTNHPISSIQHPA